jgi:hypothetical protein
MKGSMILTAALALLASCSTTKLPASLHSESMENPWADVGAGDWTVGGSTGWAFYGAEVEAEGVPGTDLKGSLGPTPRPSLLVMEAPLRSTGSSPTTSLWDSSMSTATSRRIRSRP